MTDFNQEQDPESRRERQSTQFCAECENWARKADELEHELNKRAFDASIAYVVRGERDRYKVALEDIADEMCGNCNICTNGCPHVIAKQALEAK